MEESNIRARLEKLSFEEIQEEVRKYGLRPLEDKNQCVQALITHLKRNGPLGDFNETSRSAHSTSPGLSVQANEARNVATGSSDMDRFCAVLSEQLRQERELMHQQNRELMQQMFTMMNASPRSTAQVSSPSTTDQSSRSFVSSVPPAQAVNLLSSQLSTFGGTEDEDITLWIGKVENVARIHGVTHEIALLAATSKLIGNAQRWFDHNTGTVNRSWTSFKEAITRRFKRRILLYVQMRKIEARTWNFSKESFMDYAMDKLNLMQNVTLPEADKIQLLIDGITSNALRGTATALDTEDLDHFLDQMHRITSSYVTKRNVPSKPQKGQDFTSKKDNQKKVSVDSKSEVVVKDKFCAYCKVKGHVREDCFKLKRKEQSQSVVPAVSSTTVSAVEATDTKVSSTTEVQSNEATTVACVAEPGRTIEISDSRIKVVSLNNIKSELVALLDTGSPISFIRPSIYEKYFGLSDNTRNNSKSYKALNNYPIQISGSVSSELVLSLLPGFSASIELNVLVNDSFSVDLVIGMDFINRHMIKIVYNPSDSPESKLLLQMRFLNLQTY